MSVLIVHPEVAYEMADAAAWYSKIDPELATRFLDEIYVAIQQALESPLLYREVDPPYRRVLCSNFPYRVVFEIMEDIDAIHIVAVIHQVRHPDRWKERL